MPSGRTSMLELPASVLHATHPACSERRHHQSCRRPYERKLGDQTKDDADKEPPEKNLPKNGPVGVLKRCCTMGPARIYPWRKMRRSRAPSIAPGTSFVAQSWADCITNMAGFNLRQPQGPLQELDQGLYYHPTPPGD